MAMDTTQRRDAGRELGRKMKLGINGRIADIDLDDLLAAVGSIDDMMDALPATLNGAQSIKVNFVQNIPEPFKSTTTSQEKALALVVWAMKETGLI